MNECESFLPQINSNSRILILGSMPGVKSLEQKQYYANPQNRFWRLMGEFCNFPGLPFSSYDEKIKIILNNHFALWDVVKFCIREGSLDTNIKNEAPNDIIGLLEKYKNIQKIVFNGSKAYFSFKKHFPDLLLRYKCYKMPSTSPANAKYRFEELYAVWQAGLG